MKKLFAVTLGILTAIGGFVDIGDLVTNALVGARFGMRLSWVVVLGVIGICLYADMSGRVVAISGRPVFDLIRERLGRRTGLLTLIASFLVTLLTLIAEIGGVALAFELATRSQLPAVGTAGRVGRLARHLAGQVLQAGNGLRPDGPAADHLRRRTVEARPRLGPARASGDQSPPDRSRDVGDLRVLRDRAVRRRDDAVRGVLLLLRRRRGEVDRARPVHRTVERVHRVPARRAAVAGHRRVRRGAVPAGRHPRRDTRPGGAAGSGCLRQARPRDRADRGVRGHLRRGAGDLAVIAVTRSRSTSAGNGASSSGRGRPRVSTW